MPSKPAAQHTGQTSEPISAYDRPDFDQNENEIEGFSSELLYDLLLSSIAFQDGEIDVATSALVRAAQGTDDVELIGRAVRMAIHNKSYAQAISLGERWVELAEDDDIAYIVTALAATLDQQVEPALGFLDRLFARDATRYGAYFEQVGDVFMQHAKGEEAVEVITRLANKYPELAQGWMVLAGMAQSNQDMDKMRAALDKVLALEPDNQNAAGYKLIALEKDKVAQDAFAKQFISDNPKALGFRMQQARMLLRDGQDAVAHEALLILFELDKANSEVINLIALLYQNQQDYENAAMYFKLRIELMPGDDRSRLFYASALQQLKQYDEARAALNLVKDKSVVFGAKRQLATLIEEEQGVDEAMKYLDTLNTQNESELVQLILDRELMLKRAERKVEALSLLNEALEKYASNDSLLYHRALLLIEQEDLALHEVDMLVLIERKPDNAHYHNTLGYSLLTLTERIEEAGVLIEKAFKLKPEDPYILDSKGWFEFKKGNLDTALTFLNQAFKLDRDAEIAAHIGEVYWTLGKYDIAKDFWGQGDEIEADNKSLIETKARFLQ